MSGELVPLIMVPRFTGYLGAGTYVTAPLGVDGYDTARLTLWRGPLIGTSPTVTLILEESQDAERWYALDQTTGGGKSSDLDVGLTRRWLRLRIVLSGTNAGFTCWATGTLQRRLES